MNNPVLKKDRQIQKSMILINATVNFKISVMRIKKICLTQNSC